MFIDIDLSKTPQKPKLYLCKPNKTIIASLKEYFGATLKLSLTTLNELVFKLPYQLEIDHQLQYNTHCEILKNRYLIKLVLGSVISYYVIDNPAPSADDDADFLEVNCYSLEYELKNKNLRSYKVDGVLLPEIMNGFSRDITTIDPNTGLSTTTTENTEGILKDTSWTLGTYSEILNSTYRSFDISIDTKLAFILDMADAFNLIAQFDSINRKINFSTIDEAGLNRGLRITNKKYLKTIVQSIDSEIFCTRLKPYGKDGLTINAVNPSGSYIEDYSYFLFPFQRNEDTKEVLVSSDYMSNDLCNKLLDYQLLLSQSSDTFNTLLTQLTTLQTSLTTKQNEMTILTDEMAVIDDNIETAKNLGNSTTTLIAEKTAKQTEIDVKQSEIDDINLQIAEVNLQMTEITTGLSYDTYFADTPELLVELQTSFMIDKNWENTSLINAHDLYLYAQDEMLNRKHPKTIIQISIVNFLEILSEQSNWDKINIGDAIAIQHKQLGIDITARIIEVSFDFENAEVQLTISNVKTASRRLSDSLYNSGSVVDIINLNQYRWNESEANAKDYVDKQIQEVNGTLYNLQIDITRFGSDGWITKDESKQLKLTLEKAISESEDLLNVAENLEITTEKDNYDAALDTLSNELYTNWIGTDINPLTFPIAITIEERNYVIGLFKDVENTKSILINAISKARQTDALNYTDNQITELNTALSAFQTQVNIYINNGQITQAESVILSGLFTNVQTESNDIIAIADGLKAIVDGTDLTLVESHYVDAINDALNSIDDWLLQSTYPITIKPSKGKTVNGYLKKVETTKTALETTITQIEASNELTYVDQQIFEANVAIVSMQTDINSFAKDNFISYDESVSLKTSFTNILAESADVIAIATDLSVDQTLINNYQNSLTGTVASCGVDGLQVELAKWVDLPLIDYPKKMKTSEKKALLNKFKLVMSTKLTLNNAITIATPGYTIDGEISIRGTGDNHNSNRYLKLNKKTINTSSLSNSDNKGLMLTIISREDLSILFTQIYHTFDDDTARTALATKLNSYTDTATFDDSVIIVLTSYNSIGWNQALLDAMIKVGGTGTDTGVGKFPFAFIGIPGLFKGTGLEVFSDSGTKSPYADITTKIIDGTPYGIAIGSTLISAEATLAVQKAIVEADAANLDLTKIVSTNGLITTTEKKTVKKYWDAIVAEKPNIEASANYYDLTNYPTISNSLDVYEVGYSILYDYITPILSDMTHSSTVTNLFLDNFSTYYAVKINLLKAIMGVAKTYLSDAVTGLAESIVDLGQIVNTDLGDGSISEKDANDLSSSLAQIIAESQPFIDLATDLGLGDSDNPANEKMNYVTAINNLTTELNQWIGKPSSAYIPPIVITATDKETIATYLQNVSDTKALLQTKISTMQAEIANTVVSAKLVEFVNILYTADTTNFSNQTDSKIECWFYGYAPTLLNLPASEWTTTTIKNYHIGDLFYDISTGYGYRFSGTLWEQITDTNVLNALKSASMSQGSIDASVRIFTVTPQPPYSIQDLWLELANNSVNICVVEKETGSYVATDWIDSNEYTDDIVANITKALANKAKTDAILALEELSDISDGNKITKSEKTQLKPIWDTIVVEKINLDAQALLYPSTEMTSYYIPYDTAYNALYTYLLVTVLPNNTSNPTPILSDLTKTTNIDRDEFDGKFSDYYSTREELLEFIATSAKEYADTKASYMHIAYATNSDGTSGFNFASGTYIGIYSDSNPTASTDPTKYTWSKIVGTDGTPGSNGSSSYLHIKYSNDGGSTFTTNNGEDPGTYIGTYTDFYYLDSSLVTAYTWAKIQDTQAMDILEDYADDSKLLAFEKKFVSKEWDVIYSEYPEIINQTFYTTEGGLNITIGGSALYATNYFTPAYNALASYISTLSLSTSDTITINRNDFNNYFHNYYSTKAHLLYLISNGGWTQNTSSTETDIQTALDTANTALTNANSAATTANAANMAASDALSIAISASNTANTASSTANTALDEISGALSYIDDQIILVKQWVEANFVHQ